MGDAYDGWFWVTRIVSENSPIYKSNGGSAPYALSFLLSVPAYYEDHEDWRHYECGDMKIWWINEFLRKYSFWWITVWFASRGVGPNRSSPVHSNIFWRSFEGSRTRWGIGWFCKLPCSAEPTFFVLIWRSLEGSRTRWRIRWVWKLPCSAEPTFCVNPFSHCYCPL